MTLCDALLQWLVVVVRLLLAEGLGEALALACALLSTPLSLPSVLLETLGERLRDAGTVGEGATLSAALALVRKLPLAIPPVGLALLQVLACMLGKELALGQGEADALALGAALPEMLLLAVAAAVVALVLGET